MIQDNAILKELQELSSPLAGFARTMPYTVPEGYFSSLAQALVQDLACLENDDPALAFSKTMPYAVPEGYLAALPPLLAEAAMEARSIAPGTATPYDVPGGYFNSLPNALLAAAKAAGKPVQKTKSIAFYPQWQRRAVQCAAAAVLVLGVCLGMYKYMSPAAPDSTVTEQLARLDGDAINAYIDQHVDDFDTETLEASVAAANTDLYASVSSLDEEEIRDYLNETGEPDAKARN